MSATATETREAKFFVGGKSKALKGARRYLKDTGVEFTDEELHKMLFQNGDTGQYGFDPDTLDDAVHAKKHAAERANDEHDDLVPGKEEAAAHEAAQGESTATDHTADPEPASDEEPHQNGTHVFGSINHSLQNHTATAAPTPAPRASQRSTYTIEKNRPEQNGIKRPSAGGLCRAVWDAMDELREQNGGNVPTSDMVRALAGTKGWNINNAMIEFYQWRKFNGITGRAAK